jgi:hypothetical protein
MLNLALRRYINISIYIVYKMFVRYYTTNMAMTRNLEVTYMTNLTDRDRKSVV